MEVFAEREDRSESQRRWILAGHSTSTLRRQVNVQFAVSGVLRASQNKEMSYVDQNLRQYERVAREGR